MKTKLKDNLKKVINSSGRMTKLGVSTQSEYVRNSILEATDSYFVIDELYVTAGKRIAKLCGSTDAVVTNSASSGIVTTIASIIAKDNHNLVVNLHRNLNDIKKREVVLPKGHSVDYGVTISTMIELGGGKVVEAGAANFANRREIEAAVTENTIALLYVKSHHSVQKNMISIEELVEVGKQYQIPVIIDAAAEEDMKVYYEKGADFVIYSGTKAICAPTSGFVLCRNQKDADNLRLQYYGVGRAMKIGKENVFGLVAALEEYMDKGLNLPVQKEDMEEFVRKANEIEGITASLIQDEAGRAIFRGSLKFDTDKFGKSADQVNKELNKGNPAIYNRDHQHNLGILNFDPRPLTSKDQLTTILNRIKEIGGK